MAAERELGDRLRDELERRALSARGAGPELGVSGATVSKWLNRESIPAREHVPKIARFLRVSEKEALTLRNRMVRQSIPLPDRIGNVEEAIAELRDTMESQRDAVVDLSQTVRELLDFIRNFPWQRLEHPGENAASGS